MLNGAWKPRCLITETGLVYSMDRVTPNDLVDDQACTQIFGSAPEDLPERIAVFRLHRRATFATDRILSNLCNYARNSEPFARVKQNSANRSGF